ncbi:MAG: hypothetical protein Q8R96_17950 [Bacteroidota bacterium]|nr:hypothetical protein [Bacteroidota bacterium]
MNSAEIKLDLFRKIDNLDNRKLKEIYNSIVGLLNSPSAGETSLSPELKAALDDALDGSKKGQVSTHEEVMQRTRKKYSNLFK